MADEFKKQTARRKRASTVPNFGKFSEDCETPSADPTSMEFQQHIAGIASTMQNMKRKRMEKAITVVIEKSVKRMEDTVASQMAEKQVMCEQFFKQGVEMMEKYRQESLNNKKEIEELQKLIASRQKRYQQTLMMQADCLKQFDGVMRTFYSGILALNTDHEKKREELTKEIEEDVNQVQKSLLAEEHQKDLANMHQSMRAFMFM